MKKENTNHKNIENVLDNKIILSGKEKEIKICNIIMYTLLFMTLLIFIGFLVSKQIEMIIVFSLFLSIESCTLEYINTKIIIENKNIIKTSLFNHKQIGNISQITSISDDIYYVTVLNNNKRFFAFNIHGRDDNLKFYKYLKNKYRHSVRIEGIFKKFQIINNKIIYKNFFINKIYNISNLTEIKYEKQYYLGNIYNLHVIKGYIGNKKVFKIGSFTTEKIKLLKEIIKEYNSKCKINYKK